MSMTINAQVDAAGNFHLPGGARLPEGYATITFYTPEDWAAMKMTEMVWAKDWLTPEEDEAWADWQQDN